MKRSAGLFGGKRPDKRLPPLVILQFLAIAMTILTFFWYRWANQSRIVAQNQNYITDYTLQQALQLEQSMDEAQALVVNAAHQYAMLTELQPDMDVLEKLEAIYDDNLFDRILYVTPEGLDINSYGQVDVSDREYFRRGMAGETGWEKVTSRLTGKDVLAFYSPIELDGRIIGILAGLYSEEKVQHLFSGELFHYDPHTYLILPDGTIVAGSGSSVKSGNILKGFAKETFHSQMKYQDVVDFIGDPSERSISFSFGTGDRVSEATIAKPEHSDWLLLSVLPASVTEQMIQSVAQTGLILLAVLSIAFFVILVSTLNSHRKQEKFLQTAVNKATADLQKTLEEEREQQAIIGSLSSIYAEVFYFSLSSRSYRIIQFQSSDGSWHWENRIPPQGGIDETYQKFIAQLILPAHVPALEAFLDIDTLGERMRSTDTLSMEYQMHDGTWCRGTIVASKRDEDGTLRSAVFAVQIIQGEKELELQTQEALREAYAAAQLANRAKTSFLSNMSHDMRTPMNAVIGMTAIAGSHLDDKERVSDCLKKIEASSRHLLQLINEILDMSKIESGKVDLAEDEFSLSDLMENMLTLNHSLICEHHHTLDVKLVRLVHENVIGDSVRLQQVFTNLLSNAAKYTPDYGQIHVVLTEKELTGDGAAWYEITFEDNGIGMSMNYLEHLFEPFVRSEEQVNKIQGTGLGMPIARNIIRMMGGDITVESALGQGTKFTVTFHLKLQENPQSEELFAGTSVLLADDDPVICESSAGMLESLGMVCDCVLSGEEAVEKVLERHGAGEDYHAVILDWKMPGIGGLGAAKAIREAVGGDVPVIILSAYDWSDIEEEAAAVGVNHFIAKPLFRSRIAHLFRTLHGHEADASLTTLQDTVGKLDFSGRRVLLVEDNELNAEIALEILDMAHLSIETAENGQKAVEMVSNAAPGYYDLILMDVQMPIMNGYEATRAIRALSRPDAGTLPIVAMTANAFVSDVKEARDAGMNDHIAKPLEFDRLVAVLRKYLGAC